MRTVLEMPQELRSRLQVERASAEVVLLYVVVRRVPASGARSLMEYECSFVAETEGGREDFTLGLRVPVTSLGPCSKAISDYGAHNQRGYVTIEVRGARPGGGESAFIWIEELIEVG